MTVYLRRQRKSPFCGRQRAQVGFVDGKQVLVVEDFVEGVDQVGLTPRYDGARAVYDGGRFVAALRLQERGRCRDAAAQALQSRVARTHQSWADFGEVGRDRRQGCSSGDGNR